VPGKENLYRISIDNKIDNSKLGTLDIQPMKDSKNSYFGENNKIYAEIRNLHVEENFRNKHLGSKLMKTAIDVFGDLNLFIYPNPNRIKDLNENNVDDYRESLINFYNKYGFKKIKETGFGMKRPPDSFEISINKNILEFDEIDIKLIENNSDIFNISFEIELESNDKDRYNNPFKFNTVIELKDNINYLYFKQFGRNIEETSEISENKMAYKNLLNKLFNEKDNIVEAIFDIDMNESPAETKISLLLRPLITSKYFNYKKNTITGVSDHLMIEFKKNFPTFYKRYKNIIEIKNDITLVTGSIEIIINKEKIYLDSLDDAIEYLNVFYYDYSNINKRFFFTDRTGLHINISVKNKNKNDYNVVKGLLFLNDDLVFKDNISRMNSNWCRSVKKEFIEYIKYKKYSYHVSPGKVKRYNDLDKKTNLVSDLNSVLFNNFDLKKIEKTFNKIMFDFVNIYGKKQLGFNIYNLKEFDYIEFRYSGQNISKNTLISKLLYYCYITYLMTSDYKNKEYYRKLSGFVERIKQKLAVLPNLRIWR